MSLRVWLPLTKDLRNQGLDGVTVTTANTNVFQNEGKLGGKSLDVSGHYAFRVPSLVKKRVFSCSFWYKPITDSSLSDNWRRIVVFDTYTSDGSTTGALFRFESSYGYQSSNTSYCISIHNNPGEPIASIGTGLGATDGWNKWQHITITADGTTLRCYRDGAQVASGVMSNGGMLQGTVHIGYSGNRPVGRLNDFRLYDHCLSPMEVKELSKGLVLHYPLNRGGWGQENLLLNTQVLTPNSSTTTKNCSQRGAAARQLRTDGFYEVKCTSAWQGLSTWANVQNLVVGQKYTYSFYFYTDGSTKSLSFYPMMYNSSGTRDTSSTLSISVDGSTYQNSNARGFGAFSNTIPVRHYVTFEWNNTMASIINNGGAIELSIQVHGTFNSGEYGCIYAPKLELGEVTTPWCPNSSDALATTMGLNGTTEYDCSGFCNNGNKIGTFTYSSNSPKYNVSTYFGAYNTPHVDMLDSNLLSSLTKGSVAWWEYCTTTGNTLLFTGQDGSHYIGAGSTTIRLYDSHIGDSGITLYKDGLAQSTTQGTTVYHPNVFHTQNQWHHFVITGVNLSEWTMFKINSYGSGWPLNAYISDVRIYATALSASDVKSLYQNSAYIDSSGNVYGAVHEED